MGLKVPSHRPLPPQSHGGGGGGYRGVGKTRSITLVDCEEPDQENRVPLLGSVAARDPILAEQCVGGLPDLDTGNGPGNTLPCGSGRLHD